MLKIRISSATVAADDLIDSQRDIHILFHTANSWGLQMNDKKCSVLHLGGSSSNRDITTDFQFFMGNLAIRKSVSEADLGVTIDGSMKFHQHIASTARKAGGLVTNLLRSTLNRESFFMITLYVSHVGPIIDYCSCLWNLGYVGDLRRLESIQRRWTRSIACLEHMDYASRLKTLDLYSIKGRLIRADVLKYWKIFHGKCSIRPDQIFAPCVSVGTRGHPFKIGVTRAVRECRRRSFGMRCVALWNSLPEVVVVESSVTMFKSMLHEVLTEELFDFD